jgi:hypothetical protein
LFGLAMRLLGNKASSIKPVVNFHLSPQTIPSFSFMGDRYDCFINTYRREDNSRSMWCVSWII